MSENFYAFITGSRAHGVPKEDSDIDLAVPLHEKDYKTLWALSGADKLLFGNLNIVAFNMNNPVDAERFKAWRNTNYELCKRKPVSHEEACLAYREAGAESKYKEKVGIAIAESACHQSTNTALLDAVLREAEENGWRAVECCDDKELFVPMSILQQIITKLKKEG